MIQRLLQVMVQGIREAEIALHCGWKHDSFSILALYLLRNSVNQRYSDIVLIFVQQTK